MSEEEKQAIKELIDSSNLSLIGDGTMIIKNTTIATILNYIDKLQKENENLNKKNKRYEKYLKNKDIEHEKVLEYIETEKERDYISKDKIRDKIKELEEELVQNYGTLGESLTTTEIKTLKKLLGE